MSLSTIEPTAALIVIDLQKGIVGLPSAHPAADVIHNAALLAAAFRNSGLPVVLVNVAGGAPGRTEIARPTGTPPADWTDLVDQLDVQDDDIRITKHSWNAFSEGTLDNTLRTRGITQIVLAGIATSMGVESTARSAHERGYHVALVTDAMTDRSAEAHTNSIERIFPRLGERTTTAETIDLLERVTPE